MKTTLMLPPYADEQWHLARQMGVRHAVAVLSPDLTGAPAPDDYETLLRFKTSFEDFGIKLVGLESNQFDMTRIKLGLPGRDQDIERFNRMLENMGRLGIDLMCYNFMTVYGWFRTSSTTPARGGAHCSSYSHRLMEHAPLSEYGEVSDERLWANLEYFLKATLPVAEQYQVRMALHPDDPPVSPIRGVARIIRSVAAYERVFAVSDSPMNGCTFCQANFSLFEDIGDLRRVARRFVESGKVSFVHLRPVEGDRYEFRELFHDEGAVDFAEMLQLYADAGFDGPIRPDHAPAMYGEDHFNPSKGVLAAGYEIKGRLFAVGYMKGIMKARGITHE